MLMDAEKPRNAGVEARIKAAEACINIHTGEAVHIFSTFNLNNALFNIQFFSLDCSDTGIISKCAASNEIY